MGLFDGWFGGSDSNASDPLRRLDPKLREFLEKESPVKYNTTTKQHDETQTPQPSRQRPPEAQTLFQDSQQSQQQQQPSQSSPPVPAQSLYQDGRYAHLWKTYRPLSTLEAETKSDNEKLTDVLEAFKDRKAAIGRAALENCADEQFSWTDCMRSGTWRARMTMCRDEVHRFERCYGAQSRLLKALGYLSVQGRGADVDEEIQMRADALYHRMLAQEREVERAREEGREAPAFAPLFEEKAGGKGVAGTGAPSPAGARQEEAAAAAAVPEPSAAVVASWKERLEKLPPEERQAEEQALRAEHRAKAEMAAQIQGLWKEQAREREARKADGKETVLDKFSALVGTWSGPKTT